MKVTVLGSGTFIPNVNRHSAGYLLEVNGKKVLVDCGNGVLLQLEKLKSEIYEEIDYVFITHTHVDHISDLDALLFTFKWKKTSRTKPLVIIGPEGFKEYFKHYLETITSLSITASTRKFEIIVEEIGKEFSTEEFNVEAIATKHSSHSKCLAYKFKANEKKVVFSGDTGYFKAFINFCQESDLLLLECTIATTNKDHWDGHLNAEQCAKIAKDSNSKKLLLTHLHQDEEDNQRKLEIVKKYFENVKLAYDLMEVEL